MKKILILLAFLPLFASAFGQSKKVLLFDGKLVVINNSVVVFDYVNEMFEINADIDYTFTMTLRGISGEQIKINWGDGSDTTFSFTGGSQILTHDYSIGTYIQVWHVNPVHITYITAIGQKIYNDIPVAIKKFSNLTLLQLQNNSMTGDMSGWGGSFANMTGMETFLISNNSLAGDISGWSTGISNWTDIVTFNIGGNSFTGDLSSWAAAVTNWTKIYKLFIYSNSFTGDLSSWVTVNWADIYQIYMYSNNISGIPSLQTTAIATYLATNNAITPASKIDGLFSDLNTYFTANAPVRDLTVNVSGGTSASPTGGASNTDIVALQSIFTTAGYTFTAIIN